MSYRRLFASAFVCALAIGAPVLLKAAPWPYEGEVTNYFNGTCYWQCNNGTGGTAPASRPRLCLDICRDACGGQCIALY